MNPPNWKQVKVADICRLQNGNSFRPEQWSESGYPIIRIQNLNGNKTFNYFNGEPDERWLVQPGQMLFAWAGTKGASFGPTIWTGDVGVLNQHIFKVHPKPGIDKNWLYLVLSFVTRRIEAGAHGFKATLVHVKKSEIDKQEIGLPPLCEQRRIADILTAWDRAIETIEALIFNAREQKAALMQTLLTGKRRLPGFSGSWLDLRLGNAVLLDQKSLGANTPASFSFRYISLSDVEAGTISNALPTLTFAEAPSRARRKVQTGDILMATVRPNLQAFARITPIHEDCIASTGFAVLSHRSEFDPSFLFHSLFSQAVTDQIEALVVGSSYPAINAADVRSLKIRCPGCQEQKAIGAVLDNADMEIAANEKMLGALRKEKSALMQQLLTGKRRVNLAESEAA
jgi:type I restriction enzyme, S subunit